MQLALINAMLDMLVFVSGRQKVTPSGPASPHQERERERVRIGRRLRRVRADQDRKRPFLLLLLLLLLILFIILFLLFLLLVSARRFARTGEPESCHRFESVLCLAWSSAFPPARRRVTMIAVR